MGLTISRKRAENLTVNRQKCRLTLTTKQFKGTSDLTISEVFTENLKTEKKKKKNSSYVLKNALSRHYKTLELAYT